MSDFVWSPQNGVNRSDAETRLPEGFARVLEGVQFLPDDDTQIYKLVGRTAALTLGSPQTTTPYGIRQIQFDTQSNQMLLLANLQLYRQAASTSMGSWTSVNDLQGSPAPFARNGIFLKAIPDGLNRWISWTGAQSERPLIHDEDGNVRFLSLKKPPKATLTTLTTVAAPVRPTGSSTPATVVCDAVTTTPSAGFTTPSNAYDGDLTTSATATVGPVISGGAFVVTTKATEWTFASATYTGQTLFVHLSTSSTPPYGGDPNSSGFSSTTEALRATIYVRYSTNGSTYTQIFAGPAPQAARVVSFNLPDASSVVLRVQVIVKYFSGTAQVIANSTEIYRQATIAGNAAAIDGGTYYYTTTEVYQVTLTSGAVYEVESLPADTVYATVGPTNTTITGIQVNLPTQTNLTTDGVTHDVANKRKLFRRVYRTTKSGVWPDLGQIGEAAIADTTFTDTFVIDEITLGAPGIFTVFAGTAIIQAAGQAPAFFDATVTKGGVVVAIPANDRYRAQWCMPGQPDYWPLPSHDLGLLPSLRNDKLCGVTSIGDAILFFLRTRVVRILDLPLVNQPNFETQINKIQIDIISPNEGLAGSPRSYCLFESQKGRGVCAWVSDNGVWMTDATLLSERGMGIVKMSVNMDWEGDVDKTRLDETVLTFDPVLQIIYFDYFDQAGIEKTYLLHTHPDHWVDTGQDMAVPKVTGPHPSNTADRTVAEQDGGGYNHWSLSTSAGVIYNERTGTTNAGQPIVTHIESGWLYPDGPMGSVDMEFAGVYHNDWGINEACDLEIRYRRDQTGIIQTVLKRIRLGGARVTRVFARRSAQSIKVILRHVGNTVSTGSGQRAFGPVVLDVTPMGEINRD